MAKKIDSLQYLRAFAALWVLLTHVLQMLNINPGGVFFAGQWGVDIFFLLSGFIIFYTTKDYSSWKGFAIKRIFRIYPAYLLCVLLYSLYSVFYVNGGGYNIGVIIQNILMFPWSGPLTTKTLIVGQAWSTCYEMYFYTLLTIILLIKISKKWLMPSIIILYIFGYLVRRMCPGISSEGFLGFLFSIIGTHHVWFFCEGIIIAQMANSIQKIKTNKTILILMSVLTVLAYIIIMTTTEYNYILSLLACPLVFSVIFKANEIMPSVGIVHKIFVSLGDASFSIYLIHCLVLSFTIHQLNIASFAGVLVIGLIITCVLSLMSYRFIEKKFIEWGKIISKRIKK